MCGSLECSSNYKRLLEAENKHPEDLDRSRRSRQSKFPGIQHDPKKRTLLVS